MTGHRHYNITILHNYIMLFCKYLIYVAALLSAMALSDRGQLYEHNTDISDDTQNRSIQFPQCLHTKTLH